MSIFLRRKKAETPDAMELARGSPHLEAAVLRSRKLLRRRALTAAAAGMVPLPGLDWAVDATMLTRLLPQINAEFGLAPHQLARLDPRDKERVQKAVAVVGWLLIGRLVTRGMVLRFARMLGMRLTAAQVTKFVPIAGQLVSGVLGYTALRYLGEQHILDCVRVAHALPQLPAPEPAQAQAARRDPTGPTPS